MNDNDAGAIPEQPRPTVQLLAKQFQAKFSTKRECFNFLTLDCKAYLPHYSTVTIYFVSAIFLTSDEFFFWRSSRT